MINSKFPRFALPTLAAMLLAAVAQTARAQQATAKATDSTAANKPESLGFSSERLERLHAAM